MDKHIESLNLIKVNILTNIDTIKIASIIIIILGLLIVVGCFFGG